MNFTSGEICVRCGGAVDTNSIWERTCSRCAAEGDRALRELSNSPKRLPEVVYKQARAELTRAIMFREASVLYMERTHVRAARRQMRHSALTWRLILWQSFKP